MANTGCGCVFAKWSLGIFNIIFLLLGLGLLGIGIWVVVDTNSLLSFLPDSFQGSQNLMQGLGITVVTVGALTIVTSFLGCCGAWFENRCILGFFNVVMGCIFVILIAGGIIAAVNPDTFKDVTRQIMQHEANAVPMVENGLLAFAHNEYQCCGIDDEPACSQTYPPSQQCLIGSTSCANGCLNAVWTKLISPFTTAAEIVLFTVAGVVIIGIFFGVCLCNKPTRRREYRPF